MKRVFITLIILISSHISFSQELDIEGKVDSLLQLMTLDEKIGQMAQAERGALEVESDIGYYFLGSLLSGGGSAPTINTPEEWAKMYDRYQAEALKTRLKIPLIYGIDAVHGHNNVKGAVIMPHNIGLGCTQNPELVKEVNRITAKEVAATGIDWTFSPCIAVPKNEQWGRTYEGFGETPELQKIMAAASIEGLQGIDLSSPETILACAKHYVGDGGTTNGTDQGNTEISEEILRREHLPGYIDAIEKNVGSIMASYSSWNGVKLHGHDYLINDVLKDELGFEGFVISDWKGVDQINEDYRVSVKRAINAGIDMVMVPDRYIFFISVLKDLVNTGEVSMTRIDDAVSRILKQKFLLNLFDEPYTDMSLLESVGSQEHRNVARQAVRESQVLLAAKKNVLPLDANNQKILVAGRLADDLGAQCGGWTISWQGNNGDITYGTTILDAIYEQAGAENVIYSANGITSESIDVVVMVVGEDPYAEGAGDRTSLELNNEDIELAKKLAEYNVPVIALLLSGRPMIIGEILPYTDAFIASWLPGTEGNGVADIIFGDYNPTGKLSHSWPKNMTQVPINVEDENISPLFSYQHGMSEFPTDESQFIPYTASLNSEGTKILLDLNSIVEQLSVLENDFTAEIDGAAVSITEVSISASDGFRLELTLETKIESLESSITVSYKGSGVESGSQTLSNFENYYVHNSSVLPGIPIAVPGRVEAEDYFAMFGISTEETSDIGGGENVGWLEDGDWMNYYINVETAGNYEITGRISGYNGGILSLNFSDGSNTLLNYSSTEGWQSWQDFTTTIDLEEGLQTLRVQANADGFNINYFDFELVPVLGLEKARLSELTVYPNPVEEQFSVEFEIYEPRELKISLYDFNGKLISRLYEGKATTGHFLKSFELTKSVKAGLYILEVRDGLKRHFKKLLVND